MVRRGSPVRVRLRALRDMTVLVHLSGNSTLRVDVDFEEMSAAYETALEKNRLLRITSDDGTTRAVNPLQIVFFQQADGAPEPQPGRGEPAA
jgi:hypothetical protein